MRNAHPQKGSVLCLQFDDLRVMSGGSDGLVIITDIISGRPLQTLRGHDAPVVALQFDHRSLITLSSDNALRHWHWQRGSDDADAAHGDRMHIVAPGETIQQIAAQYRVSVPLLLSWNSIVNPLKELYVGRRVVVRRGGGKAGYVLSKTFGKDEDRGGNVARLMAIMASPLDPILARRRAEREAAERAQQKGVKASVTALINKVLG